jgi:hypothetical protein
MLIVASLTSADFQRQAYRKLKQGDSTRISLDQVQQLERLGFVWEATRGRQKKNAAPLRHAAQSDHEAKQPIHFKQTADNSNRNPQENFATGSSVSQCQGRSKFRPSADATDFGSGTLFRQLGLYTQSAAGPWPNASPSTLSNFSLARQPQQHSQRAFFPLSQGHRTTPRQNDILQLLSTLGSNPYPSYSAYNTAQQAFLSSMLPMRQPRENIGNSMATSSLSFAEQLASGSALQSNPEVPAAPDAAGPTLAAIQEAYSLSLSDVKALLQQEIQRRLAGEAPLRNNTNNLHTAAQHNDPNLLLVAQSREERYENLGTHTSDRNRPRPFTINSDEDRKLPAVNPTRSEGVTSSLDAKNKIGRAE